MDRPASEFGEVEVRFVKNVRARRFIIRVLDERSVRVTIPRGGTRAEASAFFDRHRSWLLERVDQLQRSRERSRAPWRAGKRVWYRGREERVVLLSGDGKSGVRVGNLEIPGDPFRPDLKQMIEDGMKRLAKTELPECVETLAARVGKHPSQVTVRGQKTRWGSCSSKGGLSLNWRLVQVPWEVRDYVVIHELCHLEHMNHSKRFWALVGRHCPQYQASEAWLRAHSHIITKAA